MLKKLNMLLPTIEVSSINVTLSLFSFALMVFSLPRSTAQYSKPLLAVTLKAVCSVLSLILNTSSRGSLDNFHIIWNFPTVLLRNLIRASYNAFVTVLFPTPAPPRTIVEGHLLFELIVIHDNKLTVDEECEKGFFCVWGGGGGGGRGHACGFPFNFSKVTENAIITIKLLIFSTSSLMLLSSLKTHHH